MSPETYNWILAAHVIGFVLWISGLVTVLQLLRVHHQVEGPARDVLASHERKGSMVMDLGATLAIAGGFIMAFGGSVNAFKTGAWLHVKLTIVVLAILSLHGYARVQTRRFREGQVKPIPAALTYVVLIAAAIVIILGANHDLLRK